MVKIWDDNNILDTLKKLNNFWYDFKLSSFLKMKHRICKEFVHLYKFIFIKKMIKKKIELLGQLQSFFIISCKKKSFVWKKTM
jgi:hypothetical protein